MYNSIPVSFSQEKNNQLPHSMGQYLVGTQHPELIVKNNKNFKKYRKMYGLTISEVKVLIAMVEFCRHTRNQIVSQCKLSAILGIHRDTINTALRKFHNLGLIRKMRISKWDACRYTLQVCVFKVARNLKGALFNAIEFIGNVWNRAKVLSKKIGLFSFYKISTPIYSRLCLYNNYSVRETMVVDNIRDYTPSEMDELLKKTQVSQTATGFLKKSPKTSYKSSDSSRSYEKSGQVPHYSPKSGYDKSRPWREQAREILWANGLWKDRYSVLHSIPSNDLAEYCKRTGHVSPWLEKEDPVVDVGVVQDPEIIKQQKKEALHIKAFEEARLSRERLTKKLENPLLEERMRDLFVKAIAKIDTDLVELYG